MTCRRRGERSAGCPPFSRPVMLFMGVDYLRGGVHVDRSTFE
ncbi:hypothetical protein [Haloferax chudinovii]|uniref:Uncharacterized protein n=1 Tax=Haloferax chudinovii TaxID=1109010 RepID=A0ABD5XMA9_9EURY